MYNFDQIIDRSNTGSLKHDLYAGRDVLPMWVADMDFVSPPEVIAALEARARHGVFGYTTARQQLKDLLVDRMAMLYNWPIEPDWIVFTAGLVSALNCICRALCKPGKEVSIFTPIYPPFLEIPATNYLERVKIPMLNDNEYYTIDFDGFERSLNPQSGLLMLSNPHNPSGRVHTRAELEKLAEICNRHKLPIISDEIHCELLLDDNKHIPVAMLDKETLNNTVTLMAPSKTFNIAGLGCGFAIIANPEMRAKIKDIVHKVSSHPNIFGYEGAYAAFKYGEPWRKELLQYLTANRDFVNSQLAGTKLKPTNPEATYLHWIDCSELELGGGETPTLYFEKRGVGVSTGAAFDAPNYIRLNFGCPRSVLAEALNRMK